MNRNGMFIQWDTVEAAGDFTVWPRVAFEIGTLVFGEEEDQPTPEKVEADLEQIEAEAKANALAWFGFDSEYRKRAVDGERISGDAARALYTRFRGEEAALLRMARQAIDWAKEAGEVDVPKHAVSDLAARLAQFVGEKLRELAVELEGKTIDALPEIMGGFVPGGAALEALKQDREPVCPTVDWVEDAKLTEAELFRANRSGSSTRGGVPVVKLRWVAALFVDAWAAHGDDWAKEHDNDRHRTTTALTLAVLDPLERAVSTKRKAERNENQLVLFDNKGALVAETTTVVGSDVLEKLANQTPTALGTFTGYRVLIHVLHKAQQLPEADHDTMTCIVYPNGVQELVEEMGLSGKKAVTEARNALEAGAQWLLRVPGRTSSLWGLDHQYGDTGAARGSAGRNGFLMISPMPIIRRNFFAKLPPDSRTLVPVVPLPSVGASNRYKAAEARYAHALVRLMVEKRRHYHELGGVPLSLEEFWRVAKAVNLTSKKTMETAVERWSDGEFLERVDRDVYYLANNDTYSAARTFMVETARRSHLAAKAGKASGRKRRNG